MPDGLDSWALFTSAFLSSTLLPGSSEAVLAWLAADAVSFPWQLWAIASLGNTLGGLSSWLLGWLAAKGIGRWSHAPRPEALERFARYGQPALLLSWVPLLGDPLCVAAGYLRVPLWAATIWIATGKAARYLLLLWLLR
ncbi:MAG: VTT domain-containing protein [Gammaproteobacteria bacterium]|nr:VTT domain-containing protein [Gammaproteobacteria bacterium]